MDGKEFVGCIFKGNSNAFLCKFAITEVGGGAFCPLQKKQETKLEALQSLYHFLLTSNM